MLIAFPAGILLAVARESLYAPFRFWVHFD